MAWWDSAIFELGGFEFGHARGTIRTFGWDTSGIAYRSQDVASPSGDSVLMGRDRRAGGSWALRLRTLSGGGEAGAQAHVAELVRVWQPPPGPIVTVPLRYRLAGRWRRVYGRPRGISLPTTDIMVHQGRAEVEATFDLADPLHYSDAESSLSLGIVSASSAGLAFPTAPPFTWRSDGAPQSRFAVVGGDAPAPLRVTFTGPVVRPWVRVGDVLVQLTGELAYDETLTVDARLMTITRADGASVPGMLAPRTRMVDLRLPPGEHEVTFGGSDLTGTATATVAWRDAWRSL